MKKFEFCEKDYQRALKTHLQIKEKNRQAVLRRVELDIFRWIQTKIHSFIKDPATTVYQSFYIWNDYRLEDEEIKKKARSFLQHATEQISFHFMNSEKRLRTSSGVLLILEFDPAKRAIICHETKWC